MAVLIDGKELARKIRMGLKDEVAELKVKGIKGFVPFTGYYNAQNIIAFIQDLSV